MRQDYKLEHRTSLRAISRMNGNLEEGQIKVLEQYGFRGIARLTQDYIDKDFLRWIIGRYDQHISTLKIHGKQMVVTDGVVHEVLGIPYTGSLFDIEAKDLKLYDKHKALFIIKNGKVNAKALEERLMNCTDGTGEEFVILYIALVFAYLLFPETHSNLNAIYLNLVTNINSFRRKSLAALVREKLN